MTGLSAENKFRDVFNERIITSFASDIKNVWHNFDEKGFLSEIILDLERLGFKERSDLIRDKLAKYLPDNFEKAVDILLKSLRSELNNFGDIKTNWDGFIILPQTSFVAKYGRSHFELSMGALYEMTKRLSAENDLRTFIEVDFTRSMRILHNWCEDKNHHIRRLVSEGTRSRLPLAGRIKRFQEDPLPVIDLLEKLKDDHSLYVRRSVANNINDIAKDNPDIAVYTLQRWNLSSSEKVKWVVRHASRNLIKKGNLEILKMFGCEIDAKIEVSKFICDPDKQRIGRDLRFYFDLESKSEEDQKLIIDFVVYFKKESGKNLPKVFKLKKLILKSQEKVKISKKLSLKHASTRNIYSGQHWIEILVNGKSHSKEFFEVI
ncbi:MAG: 3-methyladenine DNA glycosylase AlkC [Rickettsiales bacterium]|jgi:3-methyladenine DNA glycosylase AlkC